MNVETELELRAQALSLSLSRSHPNESTDDIIARAKKFYDFLKGNENA